MQKQKNRPLQTLLNCDVEEGSANILPSKAEGGAESKKTPTLVPPLLRCIGGFSSHATISSRGKGRMQVSTGLKPPFTAV